MNSAHKPSTQFGAASCLRSVLCVCLLAIASIAASQIHAADEESRIRALLGDGAVVLRSPSGEELISVNADIPMVPASTLKIPLAHVALEVLGEEFRFATHFFTQTTSNGASDLLIRGYGDPLLVSEEIESIAQTLYARGLRRINRVIVDDSAFSPDLSLPIEPGANDPYAARNSALAANFNTVNLAWNARGELISGEPQTPLTDVARELRSRLRPGQAERINLGADPVTNLRQTQQLFQLFLEAAGVEIVDHGFYREFLDTDSNSWTSFYEHQSSRSLRDNLEGMLLYSNNFIANQLFLTVGAVRQGYPVTAESAREVLQQELASLHGEGVGSSEQSLLMIEGSGLDRSQRITAATMIEILERFKPHYELLPEENGVFSKSGTLTGVYNYAGYIRKSDGLYPFVILTAQLANNRDAIVRLLRSQ